MSFNIIACIGQNHELGLKGDLVFHIKRDMQFFRQTTLNHPIVMGYKTFKSLPNSAPLPQRENYVVTTKPNSLPSNVKPITNLPDFIEKAPKDKDFFIIGGATIYRAFLPFANKLFLTEVENSTLADVFFPNFDPKKYDKTILEQGEENGIKFTIAKYILK